MNILNYIQKEFETRVQPSLVEFVAIPNCSPDYDETWNTNGLQVKAAHHLLDWGNKQGLKGLSLEYIKEADRTPFIYGEVVPFNSMSQETIIFYGHFDKQPPLLPWAEGLHPYNPVIKDGNLYGRGSVDDGYSFYAKVMALKAIQENNLKHSRCVFLFEGDEESGRGDVEYYIEKLAARIGDKVKLIVALDSGGLDYERLWVTTNLRGYIECRLTVKVLTEGVHSGDGSGIVPSSFRIARSLLDRIEDPKTGHIIQDFQVEIPPNRYQEAWDSAEFMQTRMALYPFACKTETSLPKEQGLQMYLNNTWRATLSVTGADGLPQSDIAGNVALPYTTLKLSVRVPPTYNSKKGGEILKKVLEANPPYNSTVEVTHINCGDGFNSKPFTAPLWESLNAASQLYLTGKSLAVGCGGSIPFMGFLQQMFPQSQFIISGCLVPNSNAHGPNEHLNLDFCKKVTACVSKVVSEFQA